MKTTLTISFGVVSASHQYADFKYSQLESKLKVICRQNGKCIDDITCVEIKKLVKEIDK